MQRLKMKIFNYSYDHWVLNPLDIPGDISGAGGAGYKLELGLDGRGCGKLLRWLGDAVHHIIGMLTDPGDVAPFIGFPSGMLQHVDITMNYLMK